MTGGTGTDTLIYTGDATAAAVEGTGTGTSTGLVINLGATALSNANVLGTSTQSLSGSLTSVASNTAYLFAASAPTNSTVVDTLSGFENVTVADGKNYIVGSAGANIITVGTGNDVVVAGDGNDEIVGAAGNNTLNGGKGNDTFTIAAAADLTANDTITAGT